MKKITALLRKICTNLFCKGVSCFMFFCLINKVSFSQDAVQALSLGAVHEFKNGFSKINASSAGIYVLRVTDSREVFIQITDNDCNATNCFVFGKVQGHEQATFFIRGDEKKLSGKLIFRKEKEAFDIFTNELQEVFIAPIDIDKVICVNYNRYKEEEGRYDDSDKENNETSKKSDETMMVPLLNSLPGAYGTLYLDFDGETVTAASGWGDITAAPSGFTNANITTIWTAVSEDYSPFDVNVTTDSNVFNSAIATQRMMVIFTPTDDAYPGAGGVAYVSSWGSGSPCWVFNYTVKKAEEAASHETGHTLGLYHDGTSTQGYYYGHGDWAPIMGVGYYQSIVQWSQGEYLDANNLSDDLAYIDFKVPYRVDDHGSTTATASNLIADASGNVLASNNFGVIEKRTDLDIFKINASSGNINLTIEAKTESGSASVPDLDIQARLLDASGSEIIKVDPANMVLSTLVTISQNVSAGTYYLEIDGVAGYGSPLNAGYSDYGSLGQFSISGSFPPAPTTGIIENNAANEINVFPNPNSGQFTIMSPLNGNCSFELLNCLGQSVLSESEFISGSLQKNISLPGISQGVYIMVIKSKNNLFQKKVLIR